MRARLLSILIATIPVVSVGCVEAVIDTDCVDTVDRTFELATPADAALQFKIDRCRVDVEACMDLCRVTLERNSVHDVPTRCQVRFTDPTVDVKVWYEVYIGGDNCPSEPVPVFLAPDQDGQDATPEPLPRELSTRVFDLSADSPWLDGGRTCHA